MHYGGEHYIVLVEYFHARLDDAAVGREEIVLPHGRHVNVVGPPPHFGHHLPFVGTVRREGSGLEHGVVTAKSGLVCVSGFFSIWYGVLECHMLNQVLGYAHGPHVVVRIVGGESVFCEIVKHSENACETVVESEVVFTRFLVHSREVERQLPVVPVQFGHVAGCVSGKPLQGCVPPIPWQRYVQALDNRYTVFLIRFKHQVYLRLGSPVVFELHIAGGIATYVAKASIETVILVGLSLGIVLRAGYCCQQQYSAQRQKSKMFNCHKCV